ncbi:MAG: hypothetical protein AAF310_03740 [Myxococcota bacterium]
MGTRKGMFIKKQQERAPGRLLRHMFAPCVLLVGLCLMAMPALADVAKQHSITKLKQKNLFAVTYEDKPVFYLAARDAATKMSGKRRAQQASQNLTLAIQAVHATGDSGLVSFERNNKDTVTVFVRGYRITALITKDATAQGFASLKDYEAHVHTRLAGFVPMEMRRQFWQKRVLHIFLAVVFVLLGIALLRQVPRLFDRADELVFEKRGSLSSLTLLGFPLLSGQALGGLLAFSSTVGRAFSYLSVLVATLAAVLGQFDSTRLVLSQLAYSMVGPVVRGLQSTVALVPILMLVGIMLLGLHAALRVLRLLLDAMADGRYPYKGMTVARIAVLRVVLPALAIGATSLLVLALLFQRYHTPFEVIVLQLCAAVCLASVPLLARWVCGCYLLWKNIIRPGEWVQIGQVQGEVSAVSVGTIQLVPQQGGSIDVSPLYAVLHPVKYLLGPPDCVIYLTCKRNQPVKKLCERVLAVAQKIDPQARVYCHGICDSGVQLQVTVSSVHSHIEHQLYMAMCQASDQGEFDLQAGHAKSASNT